MGRLLPHHSLVSPAGAFLGRGSSHRGRLLLAHASWLMPLLPRPPALSSLPPSPPLPRQPPHFIGRIIAATTHGSLPHMAHRALHAAAQSAAQPPPPVSLAAAASTAAQPTVTAALAGPATTTAPPVSWLPCAASPTTTTTLERAAGLPIYLNKGPIHSPIATHITYHTSPPVPSCLHLPASHSSAWGGVPGPGP